MLTPEAKGRCKSNGNAAPVVAWLEHERDVIDNIVGCMIRYQDLLEPYDAHGHYSLERQRLEVLVH